MISTQLDAGAMVARLNDVEKRQFPFAFMNALNDTAYDVRIGWEANIPEVFDRPTATTLRAVVYDKATKDKLYADVGLKGSRVGRDFDAFTGSGIPPDKYLHPQVMGGVRRPKRSEVLLRRAGVLGDNEFITPAEGAPLDEHGNIARGVIQGVLSDLQASFDVAARSNAESRRKRLIRRSGSVQRRAVYFASRGKSGNRGDGKPQHLPRGIYQRILTGLGSAIRMVFAIVRNPTYDSRFQVYNLAQRIWDERFPVNFARRMEQAVATARR